MADVREAKVPDIGDFDGVPVIEVMVKPGDHVDKDQGLVTLESAKATMEVPAPFAGTVKEMKVKVGDEVSEGSVIATIEADEGGAAAKPEEPAKSQPAPAEKLPSPSGRGAGGEGLKTAQTSKAESATRETEPSPAAAQHPLPEGEGKAERHAPPIPFDADSIMPDKVPYATPAVRAFARELGVDLARVTGSERGGRITKEDVQKFVKATMSGGMPAATGGGKGLNLLPWPQIDFSKFGAIETQPLSRIKKLSGANLARNWAMIPHVT